jgi:hypothetical protein
MLVVWLLHCGLTRTKAAEIAGFSRATVQRYVAANRPVRTAAEAAERIERLTGLKREPTQIRKFLRTELGFRWRRTRAIPCPPRTGLPDHIREQKHYLETQLQPRLDLRQQRDAYRVGMVKPTAEQQTVEKLFPAIAQWVRDYGHIEVGDQEMFGFVARALDDCGLIFEDDKPDRLAEAIAALEKGLIAYFEQEGSEIEGTG